MRSILIAILLTVLGCQDSNNHSVQISEQDGLTDYAIHPVDIRNVKLTDEFWLPIIKRVQEKTISYAIEKCAEEGRFENFLIAGGKMEGEVRGYMPFDDTDVYKIIEGASNSLISSPDAKLEALLDSLISIVQTGQESDGYLTTWRTINPAKPPADWVKVKEGKRWESLAMSHELYNSGHLFEAAAVHYRATGKRNFLDIALKNADLLIQTFGKDKMQAVPGHQIVETGLIQLYRITQKKEYLDLAKYFLDQRGNADSRELFGAYSQDHIPVTRQDEAVGHAVRAVYMYAGMTDIATLMKDTAYQTAIEKIWNNIVSQKMYVTGGIGALHQGEAFGDNYELPNLTAYNETCAAIGNVYWNHRLFLQGGDVQYYDIIERTLYNGLASGLSLDGQHFFYPNPLESDGIYTFNQGACTRKSWFDCSCCPTNMIRFLPAMPGLIYAKTDQTIYVNLFVSSEALIDLNGNKVKIRQQTDYPWEGKINLTLHTDVPLEFTLKIRIPGWARNEVLPSDLYAYQQQLEESHHIEVNNADIENGYYVLSRKWKSGDHSIALDFPFSVRKITTHEKVEENKGKVALEYGPLVYAVEEIDNKGFYDQIHISGEETFEVEKKTDLLSGVNIISARNKEAHFKAVPYYAWSNRGIGKMKVWIPGSPIN